jgi:hypothetical protein
MRPRYLFKHRMSFKFEHLGKIDFIFGTKHMNEGTGQVLWMKKKQVTISCKSTLRRYSARSCDPILLLLAIS